MDAGKGNEDKLREAACFGDEEAVKKLIDKGVNVNGQHEINGWTALHWAAKRGHVSIVNHLLSRGANKNVATKKGELAGLLTDNEEIAKLLDVSGVVGNKIEENLPITPNYIAYPPVNYKVDVDGASNAVVHMQNGTQPHVHSAQAKYESSFAPFTQYEELVLKVRVAQSPDPDFIEVELPLADLTFTRLLKVCCEELQLGQDKVVKIRKLPDTLLRKDKDVQRLKNFQELELVTGCSRFTDGQFALPMHSNAANTPRRSSSFNNYKIFY